MQLALLRRQELVSCGALGLVELATDRSADACGWCARGQWQRRPGMLEEGPRLLPKSSSRKRSRNGVKLKKDASVNGARESKPIGSWVVSPVWDVDNESSAGLAGGTPPSSKQLHQSAQQLCTALVPKHALKETRDAEEE